MKQDNISLACYNYENEIVHKSQKTVVFRLKFHRSLFLRVTLTTCAHWGHHWVGTALTSDRPLPAPMKCRISLNMATLIWVNTVSGNGILPEISISQIPTSTSFFLRRLAGRCCLKAWSAGVMTPQLWCHSTFPPSVFKRTHDLNWSCCTNDPENTCPLTSTKTISPASRSLRCFSCVVDGRRTGAVLFLGSPFPM